MDAPTDNLNLTSVTQGHSEHRVDQSIIPCIERSANYYEKSHRKTPSAIYAAKEPVSIATNYHNGTESGTFIECLTSKPPTELFLIRKLSLISRTCVHNKLRSGEMCEGRE